MDRNVTIDIAKGIGIILVVLGHLSSPQYDIGWLSHMHAFIYQFHMPLFFFLSGMFLKTEETWKVFLKKKITRLYVPYVVSNLVFLAIYVVAHFLNSEQTVPIDTVKHAIKIVLGMAVTPLGGATWFLFVLFIAQVALYMLHVSLRKINEHYLTIFLVLAAIAGMLIQPESLAAKSLVAMSFLDLGQTMSQTGLRTLQKESTPFRYGLVILFTGVVVIGSITNTVDMSQGEYGNPILFYLFSMAGIMMVFYVSDILSKTQILKSFLCYLGTSTIWILIFHFLAFRVVNIIQIITYHEEFNTVFSHPCARLSGLWPVVYFIAGISIPLTFKSLYRAKNA